MTNRTVEPGKQINTGNELLILTNTLLSTLYPERGLKSKFPAPSMHHCICPSRLCISVRVRVRVRVRASLHACSYLHTLIHIEWVCGRARVSKPIWASYVFLKMAHKGIHIRV